MQTKDLRGLSIDLLVPGMLVNACVKSILENGVMLSFLTYFTGTVSASCNCCKWNASIVYIDSVDKLNALTTLMFRIFSLQVDLFHLQNIYPGKNWKDKCSESQKVLLNYTFAAFTTFSTDKLYPSICLTHWNTFIGSSFCMTYQVIECKIFHACVASSDIIF